MKTITLKRMKCIQTEDILGDDEIKLQIALDGQHTSTLRNGNFSQREIWQLNKTYTYNDSIQLKLYDEDWSDSDDHLGTHNLTLEISAEDATVSFVKDEAYYELIFDLVVTRPSNNPDSLLTKPLSLYSFFSRMGQGIMDSNQYHTKIDLQKIYRIGNEVVSIKDAFNRNRPQDRNKYKTNSIREWIQTHCNYFSADTYLNNKPPFSESDVFWHNKNWKIVHNEKSREIAGFQDYSRVTYTDYPGTHETRDWNWDLIPDPQFMYLLGAGMKHKGEGQSLVPILHNEWESGSFPIQWRPFWGEYVTFWGRHIWDTGHDPVVTEIHPAHSIVREHTTASPIGKNNAVVPVNQAFIGMGLSGGFPHKTSTRWQIEFGGVPNGISGDTKNCWPTNLKKHPLKFKFYPPTDRPSITANLIFNVKICQHISVQNNKKLDDFLELTQYDDPAAGGKKRGFRIWNETHGHSPQTTAIAFQPKATLRKGPDGNDAFFDVEIDLGQMPKIPVGYFAILECGWDELGQHQLAKYDVTFERIKVIETDEYWGDEWHLYYGVNGLWQRPWWTGDNSIDEGDSFTKNTKVSCWVLDDMPLSIRDTGIEWDGTDHWNEKLDTVNLVIQGPQHLDTLKRLINEDPNHLNLVDHKLDNSIPFVKFKVKGKGGSTKHQWIINIEQKQIL